MISTIGRRGEKMGGDFMGKSKGGVVRPLLWLRLSRGLAGWDLVVKEIKWLFNGLSFSLGQWGLTESLILF